MMIIRAKMTIKIDNWIVLGVEDFILNITKNLFVDRILLDYLKEFSSLDLKNRSILDCFYYIWIWLTSEEGKLSKNVTFGNNFYCLFTLLINEEWEFPRFYEIQWLFIINEVRTYNFILAIWKFINYSYYIIKTLLWKILFKDGISRNNHFVGFKHESLL